MKAQESDQWQCVAGNATRLAESFESQLATAKAEIERLREALESAMRQWAMYYSDHNSDDIESGRHPEADLYRSCRQALAPSGEKL